MRILSPIRKLKWLSLALLVLPYSNSVSAQTAKAPAEVPFEFVHNQIVVAANIGGKGPFNLLIDTDTDPSAIDSATAKQLGLDIGSRGSTAVGGGTEKNLIYPTRLPSVELGPVTARDVVAATIDLSKLADRIGRPIHGVLGYSFLKDRIVQIDYAHSKLRFLAESPYPRINLAPNTVNIIAFPMRREDGDVLIDSVFVNGEKMIATLDTGSSGTFALTPEATAILGIENEGLKDAPQTSIGYNGEHQSKQGVLKSVRLGRMTIDSPQADFWLPETGHDKKRYQVNIGNGFFEDFLMTFDFRNKMVVFERLD
jgi:predicted aspartyl protease